MTLRRGALVVAFAFMVGAPAALANVASMFGFGPLSMSTGGTSFLAGQYDSFAVYSAPAALGYLSSVEASLGHFSMDPRLKSFGTVVLNANGTQGEFSESGVLPGTGQTLAFALPLGKKSRPVTIGGAFYLPSASLARVSGSPVNYPFYPMYSDISRNAFYVFGLGYRIWGKLAIGVNFRSSVKSLAEYQLRADNTINYSASAVEARSQSRFSASGVYDSGYGGGENPFVIGLMYRANSSMETKLTADISSFVPVQGVLTSTSAFSPAEWVLALSKRLDSVGLTGSLDAAWVKWGSYTSPYGSGNINFYAIGNTRQEAGFKDVFVPRVGLEKVARYSGAVRRLAFRAGFFHYPSPVPDQTDDSNFVDMDRNAYTAGMGAGFRNPWREGDDNLIRLDAYFQYNRLANRQITKKSSTNVGAPGYLAGGKIFLYGVAGTFVF